MNRTPTPLLLVLAGALLAPLPRCLASGSYSQRPPRVPAGSAKAADPARERFALGQRIFNGKDALTAAADMAAQKPRLQALQDRLPAAVASKKDLPALAGKLTDPQLDALEHFVGERYGTKK